MASYKNFTSKNKKHTKDRTDIYDAAFETPLNPDDNSNLIGKNISKWAEFTSFIRFYPDIFYDMLKPEVGGIELDLYQRVMMRTLSRFPQNYFCIPRGGSKCVAGDTVLFTENGLVEIGELFNYEKKESEVETIHKISMKNRYGLMETSMAGISSGFKKTKKIKTQDGYDLEASLNHPVLVMCEDGKLRYKNSSEIKVGDLLPISRNNNVFGSETKLNVSFDDFLNGFSNQGRWQVERNKFNIPEHIDEQLALIIGYLLGDGCLTRNNSILFTNEDEDILNNYIDYFNNVLGIAVKQKDRINFIVFGKLIREFFRQLGLEEKDAFGKEIPKIILKAPKNIVAKTIQGLFDTDGCVTNKSVQFCTASEKMSKQVQMLLLNFGIISFRKKYLNKKFNTYHYKINISTKNIDLFLREIGFSCSRKQEKLISICNKNRNPNKDVIPYQQDNIIAIYPKGKTRDKFYHLLKGSNDLTYEKLSLLLSENERFDNKDSDEFNHLVELYDSNYYYTKVIETEDSENYVYDLYMPLTNSFVSNGLVSHNTLTQIMVAYHTAICFPNVTLAITASTKESAVKIWKEKHEEILRFYPSIKDEIKSENFSKDSGRVEFQNGAIIDNLANAQSSKGLRRRRGSLEESALIDKDLYDDAIEPIFNIPRTTMTGEIDPAELNGQINRFSTSGYKNSDEYEKILTMVKETGDLKGSFVFGSDWRIPIHFGRQKMSVINKARQGNVTRFRQNYLCDWIGASDGALINISKLIKARTITHPELSCPRDKNKNFLLHEYVIGVDVARSAAESNNKTAIVVLKIIRNSNNLIRQVQVVNIIEPPNGLSFKEQSIMVKRVFKNYGGNQDTSLSRVKAVIVDGNGVGGGLIDRLLEDVTDPETNEELGCWATINTDQKPDVPNSPEIVYNLKSQGINQDIITQFLDYVESGKLKLLKSYDDIKNQKSISDDVMIEAACIQTQLFIDEVANLRIKKTQNSFTVEQVVKRIDKDRYSAIAYALYYIALFLEKEESDDEYSFGFFFN
ncbi:LAGLIDADG family homing endonuclease [Bacillus sp. J14]|uniref:LAGLIDADG family homing endonuclease n=1 Tax=Bacillus sp. J14 TaxID=3411628 RepID=UPI003B9412BA